MFSYFWFLLAFVGLVYAVLGFANGEVTFGSTSKVNGRELKLYGLAAYLFSLASLSAAVVMASIGASHFYAQHSDLFFRIGKIAMGTTVLFFLATGIAVFLK